jgi:hypothetical protein
MVMWVEARCGLDDGHKIMIGVLDDCPDLDGLAVASSSTVAI